MIQSMKEWGQIDMFFYMPFLKMDYWRFGDMTSRKFRTSVGRDHSLGRRVQLLALDNGLRGAHAAEDAVCDVGVLPVLGRATEEECNHRVLVRMTLFSSASWNGGRGTRWSCTDYIE